MDRVAIEELFTFTDYSWGEYERVIRPHGDEIFDGARARLGVARPPRRVGTHGVGVRPLVGGSGPNDR